MGFGEIGGDLRGNLLIALFQATEAGNCCSPRLDRFARRRPFAKQRHALVVAKIAERTQRGVRRKSSGESAFTAAVSTTKAFAAFSLPSDCSALARARHDASSLAMAESFAATFSSSLMLPSAATMFL